MTAVIIGSIGFLCCFLYDHNSIRLKKSFLHPFFSIGCFLIAVSTGLVIRNCWPRRGSSFFISAVFLAAALLFLGLLIYTLFFALPFDETYVKENHERLAYTGGVYALCRHPGVLWFAGFYFCLAGFLGSGKAMGAFGVLIVWNILYIFCQDRIVFPETFSNYGAYQQTTPFLIPDRNSTAACIKTWRKGGKRR